MADVRLQRSTKLHLLAAAIALAGFGMIAARLWLLEASPFTGALAIVGLILMFVGVLSGLGFGPLGRASNRAAVEEDTVYRRSLEPKQPWQQ